MKKLNLAIFIFALFPILCYAQSVSINYDGSIADSSAMLDIKSNNSGILIPRLTEDQKNSIESPANGLLIYQTTGVKGFYYYETNEWRWLYSGDIPNLPGNVAHWIRPVNNNYIQPDGNPNIKVHDANETYGLFYDGNTNQYGVFSQTSSATEPTSAIVGYSNIEGKTTYGYLGYNGIFQSTTGGMGTIFGSGVYGVAEDPGRTAGFFRSTKNAEYAANIAYSDVWIPGYFYADDIDNNFDSRPALYGNLNVHMNKSGHQPAIKGFSICEANGTSGTTVGGEFIASGNNQIAFGVHGEALSTSVPVGIYGKASPTNGWAIYADGDFGGNGAKYFIIDHPLDPENKILKHACIESNEILNHYRGNVILDETGSATIILPEYFNNININYSYQLTPIGAAAPNLHIKKEINNNEFSIAGGEPNMKVSWCVEAERNDAFIKHNPESKNMVTEKPSNMKGLYLDNESYNKPKSKSFFNKDKKHNTSIKKQKD